MWISKANLCRIYFKNIRTWFLNLWIALTVCRENNIWNERNSPLIYSVKRQNRIYNKIEIRHKNNQIDNDCWIKWNRDEFWQPYTIFLQRNTPNHSLPAFHCCQCFISTVLPNRENLAVNERPPKYFRTCCQLSLVFINWLINFVFLLLITSAKFYKIIRHASHMNHNRIGRYEDISQVIQSFMVNAKTVYY